MKKMILLTILALGAAGFIHAARPAQERLSLTAAVAFESEYVDDGILTAHHVTMTSLEGSYKLWRGELEFGLTSISGQNNDYTEGKFFAGYDWELGDKWEVEVGVGYTWYPNQSTNPTIDRTYEVYGQVEYEDSWGLNPEVCLTYDLAVEQWLLQGCVGHEWSLESCGMKDFSLEVGAFAGVLGANDADSDQVRARQRTATALAG